MQEVKAINAVLRLARDQEGHYGVISDEVRDAALGVIHCLPGNLTIRVSPAAGGKVCLTLERDAENTLSLLVSGKACSWEWHSVKTGICFADDAAAIAAVVRLGRLESTF